VRQKNTREAIQSLAKAAELDVDNRRYQYVYALALQSVGKLDQAMDILRRTHERHPSDADILYALVTFNRDAGKREDALVYARKLQTLIPDNPAIEQLVEALTKP